MTGARLAAANDGVCVECGHRHQGPGLGGICVGCPCPFQDTPSGPITGGLSEQGVNVLRGRIMAAHAAITRGRDRTETAQLIASGQGIAYEHVLDMLADAVDSE